MKRNKPVMTFYPSAGKWVARASRKDNTELFISECPRIAYGAFIGFNTAMQAKG